MQQHMEGHGAACAFTGHRATKLPWGFCEADPRALALKERIFDAAEAVYAAGVGRFLCGMANGCDLYFCEAVIRLRAEHPDIELEAAIPFEGQADRWPPAERARYHRLLTECDERTLLQKEYSPDCLLRRNRYMVDRADILIAAFDGHSGGTLHTVRYALSCRREIIELPIDV